MGTRHLTMVFEGGEYRVAQYGQWDGYPHGAGLKVLEFARTPGALAALRAKLPTLVRATNETHPDAPSLDRDLGAGILAMIVGSADGLPVALDVEFAADSLYCEWVWVIDFDRGTFEGFEGFNHKPLRSKRERFHFLMPKARRENERRREMHNRDAKRAKIGGRKHYRFSPYYPVKHVATWPLDKLPTHEAFLAAFVKEEDDAILYHTVREIQKAK